MLFKFTLSKILLWLKTYWYIPIIVVYTLIVVILSRKVSSFSNLSKTLQIKSDSYKSQVEVLEKTREEEKEQKEKLLEKYNDVVLKLEEEYKKKNIELDNRKKKEAEKIVKEYANDPDALAKELANKFGLEYEE